jgi:hypothetical protein
LARSTVITLRGLHRKSTEHNLDPAFTSLDAQREASEAYIRSQAGEGRRMLRKAAQEGTAAIDGALVIVAARDRPALRQEQHLASGSAAVCSG